MNNPYESPEDVNHVATPPTKLRRVAGCFFLTFVGAGLLVLLLIPASRRAPEAARRMQCSNNLKQIALGLHNYHDAFGAFPPATTVDTRGRPLHSWRTLILPFFVPPHQELYESIDLSKPWDDPANANARRTEVPVFCCRGGRLGPGQTTYLAVVTSDSCLRSTEARRLEDVPDKAGTLLILEVSPRHAVHWMAPHDANEAIVLDICDADDLAHMTGVNAVCVDRSLRFLSSTISVEYLKALVSCSGEKGTLIED